MRCPNIYIPIPSSLSCFRIGDWKLISEDRWCLKRDLFCRWWPLYKSICTSHRSSDRLTGSTNRFLADVSSKWGPTSSAITDVAQMAPTSWPYFQQPQRHSAVWKRIQIRNNSYIILNFILQPLYLYWLKHHKITKEHKRLF